MEGWIFTDFRLPRADGAQLWADAIRAVGFDVAVVGVGDDADHVFSPRYSRERYAVAFDALRAAGVRPVVMPWLKRRQAWQDAVAEWVQPWCLEVLFDVEGGWVHDRKFSTAEAVRIFDGHWGTYAERLGITSFASLPSSVAGLAPHVHYGLPQAYSVMMRRPDTSSTVYRPRHTQDLAWRKWSPHFDALVMGLAAYSQSHPAPHPSGLAAMTAAAEETVRLALAAEHQRALGKPSATVYGWAWWSWKHLNAAKKAWAASTMGVDL